MWLPMVADLSVTPPPESADSRTWRAAITGLGLSATTVRWTLEEEFCGCQLFYRLPAPAVAALRRAVAAALALTDWKTKAVEHFDDD